MKQATTYWCIEGECRVDFSAVETEDEIMLMKASLPLGTNPDLDADRNAIWAVSRFQSQIVGGEFGLIFDGQPTLGFRDKSGRLFYLEYLPTGAEVWVQRLTQSLPEAKAM